MTIYEMVFSPTGGTERICDAIAEGFRSESKVEKHDILPLSQAGKAYAFQEGDVVIVGVPSFGGRVPGPAVERIRAMKGGGAAAVAVISYGNRAYEDTLMELGDELTAAGFVVVAGIAALAEHSITHHWAVGRPDEGDRAELMSWGREILSRLKEAGPQRLAAATFPGKRPYKVFPGVPHHPSADDRCDRCGACAAVCPTGAIPKEDPKQTNNDLCITCIACVAVCPQHARSESPETIRMTIERLDPFCSGHKQNELFV